jgi:branched-subunit amino acid transport protein
MAITLLILALAAGTFAIRLLPLNLLSRLKLPDWALEWLGFVPGAVLAAALAQAVLVDGEKLALSWTNAYLWAAIPAFVIAWRSKNMIFTMAAGMATYAIVARLIG